MTYTLHNRLGSGGFVIEATLALAGVPFRFDPYPSRPNEPLGAQIADLNAWGQFPVLDLPDGRRMAEVAAILVHLSCEEASVREGPNLWVDDQVAFLRWCVFLSVNVYEGTLRQSYPDRFITPQRADDEATGELFDGLNAWARRNLISTAKQRVHDAFACIERDTARHACLLGPRLSACDIYLAMLFAWHGRQPDLPKCTRITEQVATHDLIRPIWARNFHDRMAFRWHEL